MNSQSMMWLCSLLVVTLMSLQGFIRTPIRWWWDALVRIVFIVLVCVAGMIVPSIEWYAVFLGWGFVLFCFFCQKRYEKQQQMALLALDANGLRNSYKNIAWLNWGLNGSLYQDLNETLALYVEQKPEEAEKILSRWDNFPGMPPQLIYLPRAYRTTGDHILLHWQKLIDEYESLVKGTVVAPQAVAAAEASGSDAVEDEAVSSSSNDAVEGEAASSSASDAVESEASQTSAGDAVESGAASGEAAKNVVKAVNDFVAADAELKRARAQLMLLHVARAYAEQNRLVEATGCLADFKVASQAGLSHQQLALTFLPFFALAGDRDKTETLLKAARRASLIDYILMQTNYCKEHAQYWLARCARAAGDEVKAQELFKEALALSESDLFRTRINLQLSREPQKATDTEGGAERIWKEVKKAEFVQNIFRPVNPSWAVVVLILCIFAVFPLTDAWILVKDPPKVLVNLIGVLDQLGNGSISRLLEGKYVYNDLLQAAVMMRLQVMSNFALVPQMVLLKGEYWRLVTYLFLHGHFTHMMLNVLGLFFFGRMAASLFGAPKFLVIYFLGGILSGLFACLINFREPVVGASGAILAVFGAVGAAIYRLKNRIPQQVWKRQVSVMFTLGLAQVVLDQANVIQHVAGSVHLGGLLAGVLLGFIVPMNIPKEIGDDAAGGAIAPGVETPKDEAN